MSKKKKLDKPVLAEGEVTGHAHRLPDTVDVYLNEEDGTREFTLKKPAVLTHEEHGAIELAPGKLKSGQVVEYDPFTQAVENVRD